MHGSFILLCFNAELGEKGMYLSGWLPVSQEVRHHNSLHCQETRALTSSQEWQLSEEYLLQVSDITDATRFIFLFYIWYLHIPPTQCLTTWCLSLTQQSSPKRNTKFRSCSELEYECNIHQVNNSCNLCNRKIISSH
jgi:hypothetical protein